jgi:DASH complex subunit ASK1
MSRQPSQAQRPLSLTEELEKLEQSITLTMQGRIKKVNKTVQQTAHRHMSIQRSTTISVKLIG